MPGSGRLWFTGSHTGASVVNPDDIRIATVDADGTGQAVVTDHSPNPFPTGSTAGLVLNSIALDTAAGFYYALINDGAAGDDPILVRGVIGSNAAPVIVVDFTNTDIVNAIQIDVVNHRIYVGYQDGSGASTTNTGIRSYSYDPATGAVSGGSFISTWAQSGRGTESGYNFLSPNDFALDTASNSLFYTELASGSVESVGLFRVNLTTGVHTQVVSQTQFPDTGTNGFILSVELDTTTDLLYFSTESRYPHPDSTYAGTASQNAIWYISQNATNGTAVKVTLTGLPGGGYFYPGDMTLDASTRQLYVTSEENGNISTDDVIYVFQLDAAGTSASLIRTIAPSPGFVSTDGDINALAFNAIPILSALSANATHAVEGGGAVALLSGGPTITDLDGGYLRSATVQITGNLDADDDHLGFGSGQQITGTVTGTSITLAWNAATGTLTLTGYDTVAHYQSVLADIRYWTTSSNPTAAGATRTVTWAVNDSTGAIAAGSQNSGTSSITVDEGSTGPTFVSLDGDAPTYTEGGGAVRLDVAGNATVADAEQANFNGGTLTVSITAGGTAAQDILSVANIGTGAGQISLLGAAVRYEGVQIGTFTGGTSGANLVITLDSDATLAATEALVRALQYNNTASGSPSGTSRTVTVVLTDGAGGTSATQTITLGVTLVNDAPTVINGTTTTLTAVAEDVTDPAGATVSSLFGSHFSDAADAASGGTPDDFAGIMIGINYANASQGVWQVFTGGAWTTLPALSPTNTYLVSASDSLRFLPAANYNGTPGGLLILLIDDSAGPVVTGTRLDSNVTGAGGSSVYSTSTMTLGTSITAQNDAAVIVSGDTPAYSEDGGAVEVSPNLTIADVDSATMTGATITVTDFIAGDVLTFFNQYGITGSYDSGTGVLTLSGTASVADYQAALRSITYFGAADANVGGTDLARTVSFVVTDGVASNTATATVTIADFSGPTSGDDNLPGTGGDDSISGLGGDDVIDGGGGADYLDGGDGDDDLTGGTGDDYLKGGTGADHMAGGAGDDFYVVDNLGDTPDETGGDGVDTVQTRVSWTLGAGFENLNLGNGGAINGTGNGVANTLNGNASANTLSGLGGDDALNGGGGDDSLYGGAGIDALDGGNQNDFLDGGDGDDNLIGAAGDDYLRGGDGADHMEGGAGNDFYAVDDSGDTVSEAGGSGIDTVQARVSWTLGAGFENLILGSAGGATDGTGNALRNTITGNAFANTLHGLGEVDTLRGDGGNDVLYGDDGNDVLYGENGYDRLYGGAGSDRMTGGDHADTFVFTDLDIHRSTIAAAADRDQILDLSFTGDHDVIDLSAIDADIVAGGDQPFTFVTAFTNVAGQATLTFAAGITTLTLDVDGDGKADLRVELNGDLTGSTLNLYTGAGDANGGWVL